MSMVFSLLIWPSWEACRPPLSYIAMRRLARFASDIENRPPT